jgi:ribonuclease HII
MATAEKITPTFKVEKRLLAAGYSKIAGIDEAGRGPLAGPVVAAAVILNPEDIIEGLNDSKALSEKKREVLYDEIKARAIAAEFSIVSHDIINSTNILSATLTAMANAVRQINPIPDFLLIDGNQPLKSLSIIQDAIIDGDKYCVSISAASIIAKVTRDRLMKELDKKYPGYGFAQHKGYGTKQHKEAIRNLGPCDIHRVKFGGVKEYVK